MTITVVAASGAATWLHATYHSHGAAIAVAFELVKKPIQYCDMVTQNLKRKSEKTKNEMRREMIETCLRNGLKFRFCLMDSWFASDENFCFITERARHFIAALNGNRLVALSENNRNGKRFFQMDTLDFSSANTACADLQQWRAAA